MRIRARELDIGQISRSGQCFRLNPAENGYVLTAYGRRLMLCQEGEQLTLSCDEEEWEQLWRSYFDWDTDYGAIQAAVSSEDSYMQAACRFGAGIRILKQELWETIVTFIISQQNNIPRIKKCVESLCSRFGEERRDGSGEVFYTFPSPERLAALNAEELAPCHLGYRSRYILASARMAAAGQVDLARLPGLPYKEAKAELLKLCGVGKKVAECVCLFSLHHIEAFPVDTHIEAMLRTHYPEGFPFEAYAGFAGVLQQYGFYYELYGKRADERDCS